MAETTLRPEQPPGRPGELTAADLGQTPHSEGNPCALRSGVEGDGRRLRLKQFLYDWAPPAASVAPLWRTPDPTPVDAGDAVGWLGTDYKDQRGACVQRERTQLEVTVSEGSFDDGELERFLDGLAPAAPADATPVRRAPFHRLNYWARYGCRPPGVPHGLWDVGAARPYDESATLSPAGFGAAPVSVLAPPGDEWVFDSAATFPAHDAVECVYRNRANGSDHLWLTATAPSSRLAPPLPPEPADQSAERREQVDLRGETVHYAALTEARGAWEALWAEDGVRYAAWAGASNYLDGDGFRRLVDSLARPGAGRN